MPAGAPGFDTLDECYLRGETEIPILNRENVRRQCEDGNAALVAFTALGMRLRNTAQGEGLAAV
jgi:hypothetical protein